ncbi:hypothetical protein V496_02935 [Pseudogymnoascus sp. VKM F-4515 (FW-2607)]|nr:hypothetical protein V496_02935 [Pseudogymnoascus sp. VKM F-4515 (FW-2607)]KFY92877.1 hypothetical protein V498_04687 [Pseudogymnoascus sp. VKM F-4517 (FW-2822)]
MAFALGAANAPALGDWINSGLTPRAVDRYLAPHPILNARNASTTPATPGNSVNMFIDSLFEDVEFAGSIVTACADQTVFAIRCTSAAESLSNSVGSDCGPNGPVMTLTAGGGRYEAASTVTTRTMGYDVTVSVEETCTLAGTTAATCTATAGGEADGTSTSATAVVTVTSPTYYRFDVEITGGAEKTKNPAPTCSSEGAASSLNTKTMAIWALTGTFGVASLLTML